MELVVEGVDALDVDVDVENDGLQNSEAEEQAFYEQAADAC